MRFFALSRGDASCVSQPYRQVCREQPSRSFPSRARSDPCGRSDLVPRPRSGAAWAVPRRERFPEAPTLPCSQGPLCSALVALLLICPREQLSRSVNKSCDWWP